MIPRNQPQEATGTTHKCGSELVGIESREWSTEMTAD